MTLLSTFLKQSINPFSYDVTLHFITRYKETRVASTGFNITIEYIPVHEYVQGGSIAIDILRLPVNIL